MHPHSLKVTTLRARGDDDEVRRDELRLRLRGLDLESVLFRFERRCFGMAFLVEDASMLSAAGGSSGRGELLSPSTTCTIMRTARARGAGGLRGVGWTLLKLTPRDR